MTSYALSTMLAQQEPFADMHDFVRAAQATGFTLADIKSLLEYRDGVTAPCKEVRVLIEKRLVTVRERMREFRHVEKVLQAYLAICRKAEQDEPCHIIGKLDPHAPVDGPGSSRRSRRRR